MNARDEREPSPEGTGRERRPNMRVEKAGLSLCLFRPKGHVYLLNVISCRDKVMTLEGEGIITKIEPQGRQERRCHEQKQCSLNAQELLIHFIKDCGAAQEL